MKTFQLLTMVLRACVIATVICACNGTPSPRSALDAIKAGCAAAGFTLEGCADFIVDAIEREKAKSAPAEAAPIETTAPYTDGGAV